ncbi:MAG: NADPH:quinone oxidoreductase family protein [Alphaproteobacteria bacterium]|nr:NADPH:quinone oxidoreductase family protein [Alphaproteobacteria bacterium]
MRAVLCRNWGEPTDLAVEEVPAPQPGPQQVRIAVYAAGVNFADTLLVAGKYQIKPDFPFSPGLEIAGVIDMPGDDAGDLKAGQRVMAVLDYGGFAEMAIADASRVFPIPDVMDFPTAAGFPVAYGTSHVALRRRADLRSGETLLVHGAAGGVGLTAVEIGKHLGARVIGTARGADKLAVAREYGAEEVVDYGEEDVRARVLELTDGKGADVIYDPVGGDVFDISRRCIAFEGRLLVIGFASGRISEIPANHPLVKNYSVVGTYWGSYLAKNPAVIRDSFVELLDWYAAGELKPLISNALPLSQASEALELLRARKSRGKVVLTMDAD